MRYEPLEDRRLLAVVTVTTEQDIVDFDDGVTSLREAIFATNTVHGADEIVFDFGHDGPATILLTEGELKITDSLTITGSGAELLTIDASGNDPTPEEDKGDGTRIFNIDDGDRLITVDVSISGIALTGGDVLSGPSGIGGAIFSQENLTINNSHIYNNSASSGGAIGSYAETQIFESIIRNNSAFNGGGVWNSSEVSIFSSEILNNTAENDGGGIHVNGMLSVFSSDITGNYAGSQGGGVLVYGGITIGESVLAENTARGSGGGIAAFIGHLPLNLSQTIVSGNEALHGGGIYARSILVVDLVAPSSDFSESFEPSSSAGIFERFAVIIDQSTIDGNIATGSGGGVYSAIPLNIIHTTLSNNSAAVNGGGIFGGAVAIENSSIYGNSALSNGGGLMSVYASIGRGGIIAPAIITISGSTISSNTATINGGGIYLDSKGENSSILNSTITENIAGAGITRSGFGGGVLLVDGVMSFDQVVIAGNTAYSFYGYDLAALVDGRFNVDYSLIGISQGSGLSETLDGLPDAQGNLIGGERYRDRLNPRLAPLADNGGPTLTHALLPDSPAIDAGDPDAVAGVDGVPRFDQRGNPYGRVYGSRIDIGALEQQPLPGDFDFDDDVDWRDLEYWQRYFQEGNMSGADFLNWQRTYQVPLIPGERLTANSAETEATSTNTPPFAAHHADDHAPIIVTTEQDIIDFDDGVLSLREAIFATNTVPGADEIVFDFGHDGPAKISLTEGELRITDSLTITGSGAELLTIDASGNDPTPDMVDGLGSRVFLIEPPVIDLELMVEFSALTLTGGDVQGSGGAILSRANLKLEDMVIDSNSSSDQGGGVSFISPMTPGRSISTTFPTTLKILQTTISNNSTTSENRGMGGGLFVLGDVTVDIEHSSISDNRTVGSPGGGIAMGMRGSFSALNSATERVTIADSLITGNSAAGRNSYGGGIYSRESDLTIFNSTLSNNSTSGDLGDGGGFFASNGIVEVIEAQIDGNSITGEDSWGGGFRFRGFDPESRFTMTSSFVTGNWTTGTNSNGGGGHIRGHHLQITDSTISDNTSSSDGGGLFVWGVISASDPIVLKQLTLSGNQSERGGGLSLAAGDDQSVLLSHSTVAFNTSSGPDAGLFASGDVHLDHTIVAGNFNHSGEAHDVFGEVSNRFSLVGEGDEFLAPLADNGGPTPTHALLPGSPAINAGDLNAVAGENGVPLFDQRGEGFNRLVSRLDIGAFEVQELGDMNLLVDTLDDESDGDYSRGDLSLREAIELANANPVPDTIRFDESLTGGTILLTQGELRITDAVDIQGLGAELLTIDASGNDPTPDIKDGLGSRVFYVNDNNFHSQFHSLVQGLTLTGGDVRGSGGAILTTESLTLSDSLISGNATTGNQARGGGVYSRSSGFLNLDNVTISNNQAFGPGGGLGRIGSGSITINSSTIRGNSTIGSIAHGGGLWIDNGSSSFHEQEISIFDSLIHDNHTFGINADGGGIYSHKSTLSIVDSTVSSNSTFENDAHGGGIYQVDSSLTILDSTIEENSASVDGGGLYYVIPGPMRIVAADFAAQTAKFDSSLEQAGLKIQRSTFRGNQASNNGGGLAIATYPEYLLSVVESTFSENHADQNGGAISVRGRAYLQTYNSTYSDNSSNSHGGGIFIDTPNNSSQISHSTIAYNTSDDDRSGSGSGGGVFVSRGGVQLDHSIVARNSDRTQVGHDVTGFIDGEIDARYSLIGYNRGSGLSEAPIGSPDANGNIIGGQKDGIIKPRLAPLADNGGSTLTHALLTDSPAIDAGDPGFQLGIDGVPEFDQRGAPFSRLFNERIDIGAFELQPEFGNLLGDVDDDHDVDGADFLAWQRGYGFTQTATRNDGDVTGNGKVDRNDLAVWQAKFDVRPGRRLVSLEENLLRSDHLPSLTEPALADRDLAIELLTEDDPAEQFSFEEIVDDLWAEFA